MYFFGFRRGDRRTSDPGRLIVRLGLRARANETEKKSGNACRPHLVPTHQAGSRSFGAGLGYTDVLRGVDLWCVVLVFGDKAAMGRKA
jgi:hypothetical protein